MDEQRQQIVLHDGTRRSLSGADVETLRGLHWQQERIFAKRILAAPKGSKERTEAIRQGYETVFNILQQIKRATGEPLAFGFQPRHLHLVLRLLNGQHLAILSQRRECRFVRMEPKKGKI